MLIKGGLIVESDSIKKADILIENEKIKKIAEDINDIENEKIIDASGKIIFPGIIDSHTHFNLHSRGTVSADDFYSGGRSAAFGGVTTHIDYADMYNGSLIEGIEKRIEEAEDAVIDYHFHMVINNEFNPLKNAELLKDVKKFGISSLKLFTTYKDIYMLDEDKWEPLLQAAKDAGLLVTVHAEEDAIIQEKMEKYRAKGKLDIKYHPEIRPGIAEAEAIKKVCEKARDIDIPIYIVHLSSKEGFEELYKAKRKGLKVYAETTPHYLILSKEELDTQDGRLFFMTPPLREIVDNSALWHGINKNYIDVIATDHCAYNQKQKEEGKNYQDILPGIPGVETLLSLIFTHGITMNRINLMRLVELLSTNPAKIFGLYPEKGSLREGTDADLVVYDHESEYELKDEDMHSRAGYTPYRRSVISGKPVMTMLRGKIIMEDGEFKAEKGYGRFLRAK